MSRLLPLLFLIAGTAHAQNTFRAVVTDEHSGRPLAGVNVFVENTTVGAITDEQGRVILEGVPDGEQTVVFSFIGFETHRLGLIFPAEDVVHDIALEEEEIGLENVTVSATRSSRTIADIPTRVEVIAGEEIEEKIAMEPSNISMLLNESPGIMVQQTSATSGNAAIRIQGLDGRYTQILKDGFPLYGGFSGGLSIMQIPPLDLQQVEVIKGPASTLYGGDAIAGIINLVSKLPTEEGERSVLVNATTAGGLDFGGFAAKRGERIGYTVLGSANFQRAYDADDDEFTNMPRTRRFTLAPKLHFYGESTFTVGVSVMTEEREGGDLRALKDPDEGIPGFLERNASRRATSQASYEREGISLRNSLSFFDREVDYGGHDFLGAQLASYTEASYGFQRGAHEVVMGLDARTDRFDEREEEGGLSRDYRYWVGGGFAQDTWDVTPRIALEAGLRADYHNEFGAFLLPRVSVLLQPSDRLTARIGGGLGYKAPTVFLEKSEERGFRGVLPLNDEVEAETSTGGSVDVNYRTFFFDRLAVSVNQAFYFTTLRRPLIPILQSNGTLYYENGDGAIRTRGSETNLKLEFDDFKLFLGYVYLNARAEYNRLDERLPLTPTHKTYSVLVYEQHGKGRIGIEAYYTSPQQLENGGKSPGYWVGGIMAQRRFGKVNVFANLENILDTLQSPIVAGPRFGPVFLDVWGPTDGFVANAGFKYTF